MLRAVLLTSALCAAYGVDCKRDRSSGNSSSRAGKKISDDDPASTRTTPKSKRRDISSDAGITHSDANYHPVFSLVDNRALAHLIYKRGLMIRGGEPGFAKYTSFGRPWPVWKLNQLVDKLEVAVASRSVSWVTFPLSASQARDGVLSLYVKSPMEQQLRPTVNQKPLQPQRLTPGWQRVDIPITGGALRNGENRLELQWAQQGSLDQTQKGFAALSWLYVGTDPLPGDLKQLTEVQDLTLAAQGGFAFYIYPYRGTHLELIAPLQRSDEQCQVVVNIIPQAGNSTQIQPSSSSQTAEAQRVRFDLKAFAEQVVRLELIAQGTSCKQLKVHDAGLIQPGPRPALKHSPKPKNILVWLIDNTRADHLQLYNPKSRVDTPILTELGNSGVVFERAYIAGTESRVSHASIWTGMLPKQHRFIDAKAHLNPALTTLPEAIQAGGLYTAAWTANGNISKGWGFAEGWNEFHNPLHDGGGLAAEDLANHSIETIKRRGTNPFFLYIGTIDPHVSWRGRQPWLKQYYPGPYQGRYEHTVYGKDWDRLAATPSRVSPTDRKRILAIYDSTISYNDQHLGRVLKVLEQQGVRDETMIIVTSDHGEEFWEHGRIGHGGSVRDTVVSVPYIIHYPPLFGRGVRIREGVDVASLMATVLDALELPVPKEVQIASVLPLAQGNGRGYPRPAYATQYELAHAMRLEQYKLWVGGKGEPKLFLPEKLGEAHDVSAQHPLPTRWLTDALSTFLSYQSRWKQGHWGVASNHKADFLRDLQAHK